MPLTLFQIDAFASKPFEGNPAAVVPLDHWLTDDQMLAIAAENNLAETAFFVPQGEGYRLRWFTPTVEVDLCGHATLASAYVIFTHLTPDADRIAFETRSGTLIVTRGEAGRLVMDFPARPAKPMAEPRELGAMLGARPRMVMTGANLIAVFDSAADVAKLTPAFDPLGRFAAPRNQVVIATAPGDDGSGFDFVTRVFAPAHGINEDHVTGSAFCDVTPFWTRKLRQEQMVARQMSPRGGTVWTRLMDDRVIVEGTCADYLKGEILV